MTNVVTSIASGAPRAEPPSAEDRSVLAKLLEAEGLPSDDLGESGVRLFAFRDGGEVVAFAGFELYGADALLRSVVVAPPRRRAGLGRVVVAATLLEIRQLGATRAYLLTTSAESYFERLGFAAIDRASAPATILSTRQAAGLCPSSAPLMVKALA